MTHNNLHNELQALLNSATSVSDEDTAMLTQLARALPDNALRVLIHTFKEDAESLSAFIESYKAKRACLEAADIEGYQAILAAEDEEYEAESESNT